MRVLHLLKSNKYSGAENVVLTIMDACPDIEMIYASTDGPIRKVVEDRGHRFYPLEETSVRMVKKAVGELQPDIIPAQQSTMVEKSWRKVNSLCTSVTQNTAGYQCFKSG